MWDEEKPKTPPKHSVGDDLSALSIGELEARIAALRSEITRTEAEIARKAEQTRLAQDLFKS